MMRKNLLTRLVLLLFLAVVISPTDPAHAQTPTPPPPTFWEENGQAIIGALIGLVFGGILVWVLKPAFEKLGNDLASALSKLGGGWGFKKRYLTHLIEEYRGLNIRGLKTRAPVMVELEQVYVSLRAQIPDYALGRQAPPALSVGRALAQHHRLAIVGGPGSGKTTLLAYLTLTYARGDAKKRLGVAEKRLPILVPLRQLKRIVETAPSTTAPAPVPMLPAALRARLRAALLECSALQNDAALRALFSDARLAPWRDARPAADSPADRARRVIELLQGEANDADEHALALLLATLQDDIHPNNALHKRLGALASEVQQTSRTRRVANARAYNLPPTAESLASYLTTYYTELALPPRADFFETQLRKGRCLVLLDGLDEVADETERRLMAAWVDRLVTLYPKNRYIVTSRPPGYESAPLQNGFTRLDVRNFDEAEIRRFAENWCLAVELATGGAATGDRRTKQARQQAQTTARRRAADAARDLVSAITANPAIRALAVNPLLLSIIALVHRYRATLPRRRVDLYAECVDVLLGHWDTAKGLLGKLDAGQKRAVLQSLALTLQCEKRRELSRRDLAARVAGLLPGVGAAAVEADEFLDEVRERSGLLVETGLDAYAFSHLTFQEYLAARALVDDETGRETLLERLREPWWQETVLLYVGMTDATPVVSTLLADGDCDTDALLLAGRCVAEAVRLDADARSEVRARLEAAFATCSNDDFAQIGEVLAEIAGEDNVTFFLKTARDEPARRAAALWALGEMGRQPAEAQRERVIKRLLENFQEGEWQQEAGAVLAQVWGPRTAHEIRRLLPLWLTKHDATHHPQVLMQNPQRVLIAGASDAGAMTLREIQNAPDLGLYVVGFVDDNPNKLHMHIYGVQVLGTYDDIPTLIKKQRINEVIITIPAETSQGLRLVKTICEQAHVSYKTVPGVIDSARIAECVCSTMIHVPAGKFLYGDDKKLIELPEFWIDHAPVTHADYKHFIDANPNQRVPYVDEKWAQPYNWDQRARTYPPDKADHPVVLVSWHDAQAYAQWAGKRLLTKEEWEKAARGTDGRAYPWGDKFDKEKCNTSESGIGGTTPVGIYSPQGDSPYGCVDMAGNVWEWTASDWSSTSTNKVLRGGSWYSYDDYARTADRISLVPDSRGIDIGFRCGSG